MEFKQALTLSIFVKLNKTFESKDAMIKILQYGSRALQAQLLMNDANDDVGKRSKNLYKGLQSARKAYRFFRTFNEVETMLATVRGHDEVWKKLSLLARHFSMGMFWLADHVKYMIILKVIKGDPDAVTAKSGLFWTLGHFFALLLNTVALVKLQTKLAVMPKDEAESAQIRHELLVKRLMVLKSLCDLTVATSSWGVKIAKKHFGDRAIGMCGVISSSIILYKAYPSKQFSKDA